MAKIGIEEKKSVWPWIIAAIVVLLLIWALVTMLGRDQTGVGPAGADQTTATPASPDRYAGQFTSANMQLDLNADGTYTMQESPAGTGQGRWTHDASANAIQLVPNDGSQDRFFRVDGADTLVPLGPDGQPAAQMTALQRSR